MSVEAGRRCEGMWSHSESGNVGGIRAECIGEWRRRGGRHDVLVPSHCGCSPAECSKGGQLQLGRQGPVL